MKKMNTNTRITSTSDVTVGDLVDAVAEHLEHGSPRKAIENVVKETVRPCAIGKVPTVIAGDGNTKRFSGGRLRADGGCGGGCGGHGGDDFDADDVPQAEGRFAFCDEDRITKNPGAIGRIARPSPRMATTARWYDAVLQNGEVWTPYTSRRFLPAQYLGLMLQSDGNVDAAIARRYTLRDCWRLLDTELEKLVFMDKHWHSAFIERRRFLPVATVAEIFNEYLDALERNIGDREKCVFKKSTGEYCRRIQGEGRVVLWKRKEETSNGENGSVRETMSIEPTDWLERLNKRIAAARNRLRRCTSYANALEILRVYMPQVSMGTFTDSEGMTRNWLPKAWKRAFKKQGAYYTLKSLIVNCHVRYTSESGEWSRRTTEVCQSARESLDKLTNLLDEKVPAYVVHAILKRSIEESHFDIAKFLRRVGR